MIRYFRNGQILREVIYDDRGFVSSVLQFQDGQASYRAYMNSEGIWQLCHFLDGRGIVCNPDMKHRFKKTTILIWKRLFGSSLIAILKNRPKARIVL